jgi:hypothetical protein
MRRHRNRNHHHHCAAERACFVVSTAREKGIEFAIHRTRGGPVIFAYAPRACTAPTSLRRLVPPRHPSRFECSRLARRHASGARMIRVLNFRPRQKNTLRASIDLELTTIGLVLRDCTWHQREEGNEWVSLPARPYQGSDGVQRWQLIVEFAAGATTARKQFPEQALAAIHAVADQEQEAT